MAEHYELPQQPKGTAQEQLQQMYSYLYQLATILNTNQLMAGSETVTLTDAERTLMNSLSGNAGGGGNAGSQAGNSGINYSEAETLKSLIIKTAQFVKTETENYRLMLTGEENAEGQNGNWNRKKGIRVDITPDGIKQTFSYAEVISGLKSYMLNSKNYIKTGDLHDDDQDVPVYGVAIGKDVVEFEDDGTEVYKDENKVAELTADELSFYQNGDKVASYKGSKISFYSNDEEVMYIQNGKIYMAKGMEILSDEGIEMTSSGFVKILGKDDSIIQLLGTNGTTFQADSTGVVQARTMQSSTINAAYLEVTNLKVNGWINAPYKDIIVSSSRPTGVSNVVWLEPTGGIVPFDVTESVADGGTGSAWTDLGSYTWSQTCLLSSAIAAEGTNRVKISGNLYKNGSTSAWNSTLKAKLNLSNGSIVDLGTIATFPYMQSLRWNYGFTFETTISPAISASANIVSITYTFQIDVNDATANLSYPNGVTLECAGETGSGPSDACTVHYIA